MNANIVTILLLGDAGCGKTTFLSKLGQGRPFSTSEAAITLLEDTDQPFVFHIRSRNPYRIEFYDTASPDGWKNLRPDLVILCYDISCRLSLVDLKPWYQEVVTSFPWSDCLPVLILGLKRDLRRVDDPNGVVHPQEALQLAQELRSDRYMECSAATGELLEEVFEDICTVATRSMQGDGKSEGGCMAM